LFLTLGIYTTEGIKKTTTIIIKLLSIQTMHLFGVNSANLTSQSFCFTMTVRHPSIFFTMTILSSLRVNFFVMLSLLILNKVACVRVLYGRIDGL